MDYFLALMQDKSLSSKKVLWELKHCRSWSLSASWLFAIHSPFPLNNRSERSRTDDQKPEFCSSTPQKLIYKKRATLKHTPRYVLKARKLRNHPQSREWLEAYSAVPGLSKQTSNMESICDSGLLRKLKWISRQSRHQMPTFYQYHDGFDSSQKWEKKRLNQLAVLWLSWF